MKFWSVFLIALLSISLFTAMAQDDEIDDWSFDSTPLKEEKVPYFALAGGYTGSFFFGNLDEMNSILLGEFLFDENAIESPMFMNGFEIFSGIPFIENFRAGFFTKSGSLVNETPDANTEGLTKYAEYSISNSGFNFEYAYVPFKSLAITVGSGFGWGNIDINVYNSRDKIDWNNFDDNSSGTYSHSFEAGYLMIEPKLNIEYAVQNWLTFRVGAFYALSFMETGIFSDSQWKYNKGADIENFPDDINASGMGIQVGILVGLFNY